MVNNTLDKRSILLVLRAEAKRSKPPPPELLKKVDVVELRIVKPVPILSEIEQARENRSCDAAVFMSSIAVEIVNSHGINPDARYVIAVGPDTASSIRTLLGRKDVLVPGDYTSTGVVNLLRELASRQGIRVVYVYRSAHESRTLVENLGGVLNVREFSLYELLPDNECLEIAEHVLSDVVVIVFMSSLIVRTFVDHVGVHKVQNKIIVVPGPECLDTCRRLGLTNVVVADNADMHSVYRTVLRVVDHVLNDRAADADAV